MTERIEELLNLLQLKAQESTAPKTTREYYAIEATLLLAEQNKRIADLLEQATLSPLESDSKSFNVYVEGS